MTAKQRAARAKFKAVVAEAKKLRKKNPKLTQAQAVKQAWAISYSKERKGEKLGAAKKAKYEIGDMVYSYQNKNYKAPISYKKFVPWESLSKPNAKDKFVYKLKIKDGFSNWINEESLSKSILGAAPTKVKAKKSKRTSEMHTDTKSHNVNIRVLSGTKDDIISKYVKANNDIEKLEKVLLRNKETQKKPPYKTDFWKKHFVYQNKLIKKYITELKKHKAELKKLM
jgi:hypothetical protein